MAETLAFLVRLLVVRYLAFVVVRALTQARVNDGAAGNGGQSRSRFQSDGGLSRLRFDFQLLFAAAQIRFVRGLGKAKRQPFYRARFVQR